MPKSSTEGEPDYFSDFPVKQTADGEQPVGGAALVK